METKDYPSIVETLERLDEEPILFLGVTSSEAVAISLIGAVVLVPVFTALSLMLGLGIAGGGLALIADLGWLIVAAKWVGRQKEKRPGIMVWISLEKKLQRKTGLSINNYELSNEPYSADLNMVRPKVLHKQRAMLAEEDDD